MAIAYLFKSKEPGVLDYLGNKLFSFPESEVDFFIPQLVSMYITYHDIAEKLHPYLIHRCRSSVDFSLRCAWLLDAYLSTLNPEYSSSKKKASHGIKLRNLILSGELVPKDCNGNRNNISKNGFRKKTIHTHTKVDHRAIITSTYFISSSLLDDRQLLRQNCWQYKLYFLSG